MRSFLLFLNTARNNILDPRSLNFARTIMDESRANSINRSGLRNNGRELPHMFNTCKVMPVVLEGGVVLNGEPPLALSYVKLCNK